MLQAPGTPMYWSQVNTELALAPTTQLWLDHSVVRQLAGVASGPIGMYSFYSKAGVRGIGTLTQEAYGFGVAGSATAQVVFWNSGDITGSGPSATPISTRWSNVASVAGAGNGLYIRVTVSGDPITSGTTNTWLSLGTDRVFYTTQSGLGTKSTTLQVDFSRDSNGAFIICTAYVNLQPAVDNF